MLLSPKVSGIPGAALVAAALAGGADDVVPLLRSGVTNLARRLSVAEVHVVRQALEGAIADGVVGYVCRGGKIAPYKSPEGCAPGFALALPVADHANLTWVSPLTGPNDPALGNRFTTVAGIYRPELVQSLLQQEPSLWEHLQLEKPDVVVQVSDLDRPADFVMRVARQHQFGWISDELTPVALLAAHMRLAVAAVVLEDPAHARARERRSDD